MNEVRKTRYELKKQTCLSYRVAGSFCNITSNGLCQMEEPVCVTYCLSCAVFQSLQNIAISRICRWTSSAGVIRFKAIQRRQHYTAAMDGN